MVELFENNNSLFEFDNRISDCPTLEGGPKSIDFAGGQNVLIVGTDEAGRGPGAGGVFASAVCFANGANKELIEKLSSLNDSKKLSKKKREELYDIILENTINSTVCIEVEDIEKINILNASLKAMKLACENVMSEIRRYKDAQTQSRSGILARQQENVIVLVDGNKLIKEFVYSQKFIIKGDSKSASIAAASILAKVSRDRYMEVLDEKYPQYNWRKNAGYLTAEHLSAIDKYGITPHHRKSFLRKHEGKQCTLELNMYQK